jgi:DNA polymerase-3 subunit delta'
MKFESIIGQERSIRFLTQILRKQRIPNALLFTGIDGVGKQTTARTFGMALNCADPVGVSPCESCPSCQKFISGAHPDIITVEPQGIFIKIDQVRSLARQLRFAPLEGGWRVVIINNAQAMNLEASNAILKMLEEPPKGTIMILTATQTSDLLPTIVSRCQQIPFSPIPYEKIARVLVEQKGPDKETALTLALCSKGSLGKAWAMDAEKWPPWRTDLLEQVAALSLDAIQPLLALADKLSRDKGRLADGLDVIMTWFRDVLMSQIAPDRVINKDFMKEIERASKGCRISELIEKFEAVHKTQRAISQNANPRLALEVMMLRLGSGGPPGNGM